MMAGRDRVSAIGAVLLIRFAAKMPTPATVVGAICNRDRRDGDGRVCKSLPQRRGSLQRSRNVRRGALGRMPGTGTPQAEPLHARLQRGGLDGEPLRRAAGTRDTPSGLLQGVKDMGALGRREGLRGAWDGVRVGPGVAANADAGARRGVEVASRAICSVGTRTGKTLSRMIRSSGQARVRWNAVKAMRPITRPPTRNGMPRLERSPMRRQYSISTFASGGKSSGIAADRSPSRRSKAKRSSSEMSLPSRANVPSA